MQKKKRMKRVYKRWRRGKKRKYILLRKTFKRDLWKRKEAMKLGKKRRKLKM